MAREIYYSEHDLEMAMAEEEYSFGFRDGDKRDVISYPNREVVAAIWKNLGAVAEYHLDSKVRLEWAIKYAERLSQVTFFLRNAFSILLNSLNVEESDFAQHHLATYRQTESGKLIPEVPFDHFFMRIFTCVGEDAFTVATDRKNVAFPLSALNPSPHYLLRQITGVQEEGKTVFTFSFFLLVVNSGGIGSLLDDEKQDIIRLPIFKARRAND